MTNIGNLRLRGKFKKSVIRVFCSNIVYRSKINDINKKNLEMKTKTKIAEIVNPCILPIFSKNEEKIKKKTELIQNNTNNIVNNQRNHKKNISDIPLSFQNTINDNTNNNVKNEEKVLKIPKQNSENHLKSKKVQEHSKFFKSNLENADAFSNGIDLKKKIKEIETKNKNENQNNNENYYKAKLNDYEKLTKILTIYIQDMQKEISDKPTKINKNLEKKCNDLKTQNIALIKENMNLKKVILNIFDQAKKFDSMEDIRQKYLQVILF